MIRANYKKNQHNTFNEQKSVVHKEVAIKPKKY